MDILSLLLSCSLYPQDDTVKSLINVLSNGNPYYVTDKHGSVSAMYPQTQTEAEALVQQVHANNGQPLVGLMAVNTAAAATYNASPSSLFSGCKNVEVGTAMLASFEEACRSGGDKDARLCAIGQYANTIGVSAKVLQDAVQTNITASTKISDDEQQNIPAPERSGIFVEAMPDAGEKPTETRRNAVFMSMEGEPQTDMNAEMNKGPSAKAIGNVDDKSSSQKP